MKRWRRYVVTLCCVLAMLLTLAMAMFLIPMRGRVVAQAPQPAELALSPGYSLDVDAGSTVRYLHTLTNTSALTETFGIEARSLLSWPVQIYNAQYPGGTTALLPFRLRAGRAVTVGVLLDVPAGVRSGTVHTTVLTATLLRANEPYTYTWVEDFAVVKPRLVYLPLLPREYAELANGDFSDGLAAWAASGLLDVSVSQDPDDAQEPVALLGDPAYACKGGVPVGTAELSQSFALPLAPSGQSVYLHLRYRLYSNDRNPGLTDDFDAFDVLVDGTREFRDANQVNFDYCNVPPYDLGWQEVKLDLGQGGQQVTLALQLHNRPDAYYNTFVYVDDVSITVE